MAGNSKAPCYCEDESVVVVGAESKESWANETLECTSCHSLIHLKCLKSPTPSSLVNDFLFELICARCMPNEEENFTRPAKLQTVHVVTLLLHHLHSTQKGKLGFFHYRKDITSLLLQHQLHLLPHASPRNLCGSISSPLSTYRGHFESGCTYLGENGWWKLRENKPPLLNKSYPRQLVDVAAASSVPLKRADRKKKKIPDGFVTVKKRRYVAPTKRATPKEKITTVTSDELVDVEQSEPINIEAAPPSTSLVDSEPFCMSFDSSDLIDKDESTDGFDLDISASDINLEMNAGLDIDTSALCDEIPTPLDTATSSVTTDMDAESPSTSTATETQQAEEPEVPIAGSPERQQNAPVEPTDLPSKQESKEQEIINLPSAEESESAASVAATTVKKWSTYEEEKLLNILNDLLAASGTKTLPRRQHLLRRMLIVRKYKRSQGADLFDLSQSLTGENFHPSGRSLPSTTKTSRSAGLSAPVVETIHSPLDRYQTDNLYSSGDHFVPFINKLKGNSEALRSTKSCYTARTLKPYIWRDFETLPPKLKILHDIRRRGGEELPKDSIDYKYVTADHIPVINRICHQAFWPSIDLSECLQYSDFSCVSMYKKLVIGFAFMVPDVKHNEAYISFIYTHPEWRGAGIASVMVYHLIQTCMGKDVSLHVSMTNPAISLYLKFGFKVVEVIHNFYDKYHPTDSKQSPHAFYMRLDRY